MTGQELAARSIWRIPILVVTCISLFIAGRMWLNGDQGDNKPAARLPFDSLLVEGPELHSSLRTRQLDSIRDIPRDALLPENPHYSTDDEFVEAIARGASQGRLDREGIRSVLYARYETAENELGIYGLEAKSSTDADRREKTVREIWAYNESLNRARVHRNGLIIIVIWNDGVSDECWEFVNANVAKRLSD